MTFRLHLSLQAALLVLIAVHLEAQGPPCASGQNIAAFGFQCSLGGLNFATASVTPPPPFANWAISSASVQTDGSVLLTIQVGFLSFQPGVQWDYSIAGGVATIGIPNANIPDILGGSE